MFDGIRRDLFSPDFFVGRLVDTPGCSLPEPGRRRLSSWSAGSAHLTTTAELQFCPAAASGLQADLSMDFVIAGLGNPGPEYAATRHNVGFMVVDHLAGRFGLSLERVKWDARAARGRLWGRRLWLMEPQSFMNRSGAPVAGLLRFYSIGPEALVVVHDDLDMGVGRVKLVRGGGSGGHKGINSLVQTLGTADFYRLKLGIGRPGNSDAHPDMPVEKFVLAPFSETERRIIDERIDQLEDGLRLLVEGDGGAAMTLLNRLR